MANFQFYYHRVYSRLFRHLSAFYRDGRSCYTLALIHTNNNSIMIKINASSLISAILLTLITALSSKPAYSESLFDVELVLFKRLDAAGEYNYLGKDNPPDSSVKTAGSAVINLDSLPANYQIIPRANRKLEGTFNKLRSSANMRPLIHLAWRQPLEDKEQTPWMSFKVSDTPDKKGLQDFTGLIRFSRNQGLLVENFITGFKAGNNNQESIATDDTTVTTTEQDNAVAKPLAGYFTLSENRKIKINKLHYFDNPTMGLLIKITPYRATIAEQESLE